MNETRRAARAICQGARYGAASLAKRCGIAWKPRFVDALRQAEAKTINCPKNLILDSNLAARLKSLSFCHLSAVAAQCYWRSHPQCPWFRTN